jgi:hypothetical protein
MSSQDFKFDPRPLPPEKKTTIYMEDCQTLGCKDTLTMKMKEHKKVKGKGHVCNPHCDRYFQGLHHAQHAWYNEKHGRV